MVLSRQAAQAGPAACEGPCPPRAGASRKLCRRVWGPTRLPRPALRAGLVEGLLHGPVREERAGLASGKEVTAGRPSLLPVRAQRREKARAEHDVALAPALGGADAQHHAFRIDVVRAEPADLGDAQPRAVREHRDSAMLRRDERAKQALDLCPAQHHRHVHRNPHARDAHQLLGALERDGVQKPQGAGVHVDRRRAAARSRRARPRRGAGTRGSPPRPSGTGDRPKCSANRRAHPTYVSIVLALIPRSSRSSRIVSRSLRITASRARDRLEIRRCEAQDRRAQRCLRGGLGTALPHASAGLQASTPTTKRCCRAAASSNVAIRRLSALPAEPFETATLLQSTVEHASETFAHGTSQSVIAANAAGVPGSRSTTGKSAWCTGTQTRVHDFCAFPWSGGSFGFQVGKLDAILWYYIMYRAIRAIWRELALAAWGRAESARVLVPCVLMYATGVSNVGLIVRRRLVIVFRDDGVGRACTRPT